MLTKKQKKAARQAYDAAVWYDERMDALLDDPMTHAMGAPVGDFAHDWGKKHRRMISDAMNDPHLPECGKQLIWVAMEQYLP